MLTEKEMLLIDPEALPAFLYSCALTEVIFKDIKIVREPSMLGFFGAQRVGETLTPVQRKAAALVRAAQLMDQVTALQADPPQQAALLISLERHRNRQRGEIRMKFTDVEAANEINDQQLYYAAVYANDVQSVATIALCAIAVGGPMLAGAGITAIGSTTMGTIGVGSSLGYFAVPLAFKSIMAYGSGSSLFGFLMFGTSAGIPTLGELASAALNFGKDKIISDAAQLRSRAIALYNGACETLTTTNAELMKERAKILEQQIKAQLGSGAGKGPEAYMKSKAAMQELEELKRRSAGLAAGKETLKTAAGKAGSANKWMANFGGRFVPIAFLTVDVCNEYWRNQEQRAAIDQSGKRYP